jgi:hypothetical protein
LSPHSANIDGRKVEQQCGGNLTSASVLRMCQRLSRSDEIRTGSILLF